MAIAVPVSVHLGFHGIRFLVIRQSDANRFKNVKTLDDLRPFTAGVQQGWQVAKVLDFNRIKYHKNNQYESLFRMLEMGRIDFLPLSFFEAWHEINKQNRGNLIIEPHIYLCYRSTDYFYVNPRRSDLAERLKAGLEIAIDDGSRDRLFESHFDFSKLISVYNFPSRIAIDLLNPFDPASSPREYPKYWRKLGIKDEFSVNSTILSSSPKNAEK